MYNIPKTRYADPTVDFAFKRVFGTETYKAATIGLLNAVISDRVITDVRFLNNEIIGESAESRKGIVDVICTDDNGAEFICEMQNTKQKHFEERAQLYVAKRIATMTPAGGRWNYNIGKHYVIGILNYQMKGVGDRLQLHYQTIETGSGAVMQNSADYHFLLLGNFSKKESELCNDTEKWLYLLKNAAAIDEFPQEFTEDQAFETFLMGTDRANYSMEDEWRYVQEKMREWDINNALDEAAEEGEAKGIEKGKLDTAKAMLDDGVDPDKIAQYTGLSKEVIVSLK